MNSTLLLGALAFLFVEERSQATISDGAAAVAPPVPPTIPSATPPPVSAANAPPVPSIGSVIGTGFGAAVPGPAPVKAIASKVAATEGNAIEAGLKQTLTGDKEIFTGHFVTGFKDVGKGYYTAAASTAVAGVKKVGGYVQTGAKDVAHVASSIGHALGSIF